MTSQQGEQLHNFASTTVHHLREPVRMIAVYTELLLSASKGTMSSEAAESVDFLRKACLQMQQLLDGLSDFAAATIVRPRSDTRIRLELALRQALLNLHAELQAADASVTSGDLPTVFGDFDGLQTVFQHLIRNAVQYREPNRRLDITIRARRMAGEWLVDVADNGPGVAPEFREKIFELYKRLHGKTVPGNGLGLSICRAIVEAHGGRIWVEQGPEPGATFVFTLPANPPEESEAFAGDA